MAPQLAPVIWPLLFTHASTSEQEFCPIVPELPQQARTASQLSCPPSVPMFPTLKAQENSLPQSGWFVPSCPIVPELHAQAPTALHRFPNMLPSLDRHDPSFVQTSPSVVSNTALGPGHKHAVSTEAGDAMGQEEPENGGVVSVTEHVGLHTATRFGRSL